VLPLHSSHRRPCKSTQLPRLQLQPHRHLTLVLPSLLQRGPLLLPLPPFLLLSFQAHAQQRISLLQHSQVDKQLPLRVITPNQHKCVQRPPFQPRQPQTHPLRLQSILHLLQETLPLPLPFHLSHDLRCSP
jgi:hypothetical protein